MIYIYRYDSDVCSTINDEKLFVYILPPKKNTCISMLAVYLIRDGCGEKNRGHFC